MSDSYKDRRDYRPGSHRGGKGSRRRGTAKHSYFDDVPGLGDSERRQRGNNSSNSGTVRPEGGDSDHDSRDHQRR